MKITIGDRTKKFMDILGLQKYPFSDVDLKIAYRKVIVENHPDKGGSEEKTKKINEAYEELKFIALVITEEKARKVKNQAEKENEDIFKSIYWEKCTECNGTGKIIIDKGHPRFQNKKLKPNFIAINCCKCEGSGKIKNEPFNPVILEGAVLSV